MEVSIGKEIKYDAREFGNHDTNMFRLHISSVCNLDL